MRESHGAHKVRLKVIRHRRLNALSLRNRRRDLDSRRAVQKRHTSAGPRGIACRGHLLKVTIGMSPSTMAWLTLIWLPKAPARRIRSTVVTPISSINSLMPA